MAIQSIGTNNIVGINSGIDTGALVDAIIQSERGNARLLESRQLDKTNMISAYQALQAKLISLETSLGNLASGALFRKAQSEISDKDAIGVTLTDSPTLGTFDVRVLQLARNHQLASQGYDDATSASIGTGTFKIGLGDGSLYSVTIDSSNNSLVGLKDAINNAKVGVTASVVQDGTSSGAYRLILNGDRSGAKNKIKIESSLTGGTAPDFVNSKFDKPETDLFTATATSAVTLGNTATFIGTANKTYTFTIAGTGQKTIGTDNITINWSDGTNSGSILVTQADTEFALTGTGSDGLTVQFSAGVLVGGDTFKIQSFAPNLQNPSDGKITVGSSDGSGSPIEISSTSNTFKDVVAGVTINTKKVSELGESISVNVSQDVEGIKKDINSFLNAYNDAISAIDKQFVYDPGKKVSGPLSTESLLTAIQLSVRGAATGSVNGVDKKLATLGSIGIRTQSDGKLKLVSADLLEKAASTNIEGLRRLFASDIVASSPSVTFVGVSETAKAGTKYKVDITKAATRGYFRGTAITDPAVTNVVIDSTNNTIQLKVDGVASEDLVLSSGTYTTGAQLAKELQRKIDSDKNLGGKGITVSYTDDGDSGYFTINSPTYGSSSKAEINTPIDASVTSAKAIIYAASKSVLGFGSGTTVIGENVAGTINGEKASGFGQLLTGETGNKTTEGLKIKVTLTTEQLVDGEEATIDVTKGVALKVRTALSGITNSLKGSLNARVKGLTAELEDLKKQVTEQDKRLELRRATLLKRFQAMEEALGQLNSQSQYLASSLGLGGGTSSSTKK